MGDLVQKFRINSSHLQKTSYFERNEIITFTKNLRNFKEIIGTVLKTLRHVIPWLLETTQLATFCKFLGIPPFKSLDSARVLFFRQDASEGLAIIGKQSKVRLLKKCANVQGVSGFAPLSTSSPSKILSI
ncbi:hypothetical protein Tco_0645242 [Tanacetum coccineum]